MNSQISGSGQKSVDEMKKGKEVDGENKKSKDELGMELKQSIERAKLKLVEGDPKQAFEELFSRFKLIHDKLDANNPVLEQAHYILAISAIEKKDAKKSKEFFLAAFSNTIKKVKSSGDKKEETQAPKSQLVKENEILKHKAYSKFHASLGEIDKAVEELSHAIYLESLYSVDFGPEDPKLVGSYVMMGSLFRELARQRNNGGEPDDEYSQKYMRYYDLVVKIWYKMAKLCVEEYRKTGHDEFTDLLVRKEGYRALEQLKGRKNSLSPDIYQKVDIESSAKQKKNLANICFALCILTKSIARSEAKPGETIDMTEAQTHMEDCLELFAQIYGADSEKFEHCRDLLSENAHSLEVGVSDAQAEGYIEWENA